MLADDIVEGLLACDAGQSRIEYLRRSTRWPKAQFDGELCGIEFKYDEDRDDRVLLAIEQLYRMPGYGDIRWVAESKGIITIVCETGSVRLPESLDVAGDCWVVIKEVLPKNAFRGRQKPSPAAQKRARDAAVLDKEFRQIIG